MKRIIPTTHFGSLREWAGCSIIQSWGRLGVEIFWLRRKKGPKRRREKESNARIRELWWFKQGGIRDYAVPLFAIPLYGVFVLCLCGAPHTKWLFALF